MRGPREPTCGVECRVQCLAHSRFCREVTVLCPLTERVGRAGPRLEDQAHCLHSCTECPPRLCEVDIPTSTTKQRGPSEVKQLAQVQDCTAAEWEPRTPEAVCGCWADISPPWCLEGSRQVKDTGSLLSNGQTEETRIPELGRTRECSRQEVPVLSSSSPALSLLWRGGGRTLTLWKSLRLPSSYFHLRPSPSRCLPELRRRSCHGHPTPHSGRGVRLISSLLGS